MDGGEHNKKLVAADTRNRIFFARKGLQSCGNFPEEQVADRVTERIVDDLETIEIEEQDRDLFLVTPGCGERAAQAIIEQAAVGQAGERIVVGQVLDLAFGSFAVGYVDQSAFNDSRSIF